MKSLSKNIVTQLTLLHLHCQIRLLPNEQLSPPISQSLANSLASFFYQMIFSLKNSIALKLHSSPTPFDFDLPHSGEVFSDFIPVTPAEVSQLLRSMSNKSSPLEYIPTSLLKPCAECRHFLHPHLTLGKPIFHTHPFQI